MGGWVGGVPEGFNLGVLVWSLEGGRRGGYCVHCFSLGSGNCALAELRVVVESRDLQRVEILSRDRRVEGLREFRGGEVRPPTHRLPGAALALGRVPGAEPRGGDTGTVCRGCMYLGYWSIPRAVPGAEGPGDISPARLRDISECRHPQGLRGSQEITRGLSH